MTRAAFTGVMLAAALAVAIPRAAEAQQIIGGCPVLPANNIWNTPVDTLPVLVEFGVDGERRSARAPGFHADFGSGTWDGGPIGIPFVTVPATQTKYPGDVPAMTTRAIPGPYAVPLNAPIEGGSSSTGDRHAIAVDTTNCILYELYRRVSASRRAGPRTPAPSSICSSNALRPATWTSADAAGLPIMPGLVTYDEVQSGEIRHAIRFTVPQTRREFVWPARHYASSLTGTQYPRMGERFRLKASFDISTYPGGRPGDSARDEEIRDHARRQRLGLVHLGQARPALEQRQPAHARQLRGSNFEAVDATVLRIDPNSGAARQNGVTVSVSPSSASVRAGHSQTFTATVTGAPNGVTWSVNDIAGGDTARRARSTRPGSTLRRRRCPTPADGHRPRHEHGVSRSSRRRGT